MVQALVPAEMAALMTSDRFRGNGRQLIAHVGLAERCAGDFGSLETGKNRPETRLGLDAEQNEMGMLARRRDQRACRFDARMASLNGSLRG